MDVNDIKRMIEHQIISQETAERMLEALKAGILKYSPVSCSDCSHRLQCSRFLLDKDGGFVVGSCSNGKADDQKLSGLHL